jgi:uncharacterized protein involved in tellurium resistance
LVDKQALKTKKLAKGKKGVSEHHVRYKEKDGYDFTVNVTKGEHLVLTRLNWYTKKHVSRGLINALIIFCLDNWDRCEELKK